MDIDTENIEQENRIIAKIHGNITFLQLPTLIDALEKLPKDKNITLCTERLHFIDHACIDYIKHWETDRKSKMQDYEVFVAWDEMSKAYPTFKWNTFHKEHKENIH